MTLLFSSPDLTTAMYEAEVSERTEGLLKKMFQGKWARFEIVIKAKDGYKRLLKII